MPISNRQNPKKNLNSSRLGSETGLTDILKLKGEIKKQTAVTEPNRLIKKDVVSAQVLGVAKKIPPHLESSRKLPYQQVNKQSAAIKSSTDLVPSYSNIYDGNEENRNPLLYKEKHRYYLADLKLCFKQGQYLDGGQSFDDAKKIYSFMDHFEENFSYFQTSQLYKPFSGQSVDQKKLSEEVLVQLFNHSAQHQGRVLLVDLDETLVHADYVASEQEYTFEMMNGGSDEILRVSWAQMLEFNYLGQDSDAALRQTVPAGNA